LSGSAYLYVSSYVISNPFDGLDLTFLSAK